MDSEKKHQIIKEAFSSETLLNLKTIIDDVYEGLTFEEKNNFLIHLEFEFLVNIKKEINVDNIQIFILLTFLCVAFKASSVLSVVLFFVIIALSIKSVEFLKLIIFKNIFLFFKFLNDCIASSNLINWEYIF